jgi:argininosuccinate lyase
MERAALDGFTIATDLADALIAAGTSPREAHARIGAHVARAEMEGAPLDASFDARASIAAKRTRGSTAPSEVRAQILSLEQELGAIAEARA